MKPSLFDSHFHLSQSTDFEAYKSDSAQAGVGYLMVVGGNYESSSQAERFATDSINIFFSAGTHPHDAESNVNEVDKFSCLLKKESCRAVGEIGLDYFYENSDRGKQIQVFKKFLGLSLSFELPAIVHCRDADDSETAYEDAGALLKPFAAAGGRFVVHCFTGTTHWAEKFLEWGAYIGITGIVTFPKAENVREVAAMIPNERLLLETDSPYLAPVPFRGKTNHSKYLPVVAEKIAEVRNTDPAEIAATTTRNAFELFASKY